MEFWPMTLDTKEGSYGFASKACADWWAGIMWALPLYKLVRSWKHVLQTCWVAFSRFVLTQSPLSLYISWSFKKKKENTNKAELDYLIYVLLRPKKKNEKNLEAIIGILMWTWSCLLVSMFFEPDLWKLVQRRERQRRAGQLQRPFSDHSSQYIAEQFFKNNFIPHTSWAACASAAAAAVLCEDESWACPVYLSRNPSPQVLGIGIPLLCFKLSLILFLLWFLISTVCDTRLSKRGCSYSYTSPTPPPTPRRSSRCFFFSDCVVHLWICHTLPSSPHPPPTPARS